MVHLTCGRGKKGKLHDLGTGGVDEPMLNGLPHTNCHVHVISMQFRRCNFLKLRVFLPDFLLLELQLMLVRELAWHHRECTSSSGT